VVANASSKRIKITVSIYLYYNLQNKAKWLGHIFRRNIRVKHVIGGYKGWENEEEDVSSYRMTFKKK
jgi:hypothetical protein